MYNSDRSLTDRSKDELGLGGVADAVAMRLKALQPADGIVVGLQSPWGMGKSTFLNYLVETLEGEPQTIIVRFAPWLVDDRNALLHELFAELSRGLERKESHHAQRWDVEEYKKRREAAHRLRKFARLADKLKSLPKEAPHISWLKDASDLPVLREVCASFNFIIASVAAFKPRDETLRELKDDIVSRLSLLKYRIIVVIDDVDRLEVAEAREVFRLVRAVADFPNTTYLVAFDRVPLDLDVQRGADITRTYLDKIIQVPIFLPPPEAVDLQRLVNRMLAGGDGHSGILGRPMRSANARPGESEASRFNMALGPLVRTYLNSPRRIGIVHNILMTIWPPISDDADICDILIHLCLMNFDRPLGAWVDDYLALRVSSRRSGGNADLSDKLKARVDDMLDANLSLRDDRLALLRSLLPSMRQF